MAIDKLNGVVFSGGDFTATTVSASSTITAGSLVGANLNRHFINELIMSRPSVSTIRIGTGSCTDYTNSVYMDLTASITLDITNSGLDGLDAGSEASSTWYAVYVISGTSGMGGLLSTSETAPTMPSGFTYKRRVGWTYNHSDDDLQNFTQGGLGRERTYYWLYTDSGAFIKVLNSATSNGFRTAVNCSTQVPPSARAYILVPRPGAASDQYRDQASIMPLAASGGIGWVLTRGWLDNTTAGGSGITRVPVEFPVNRGDGQILGFNYVTYYNGDLTAWVVGWKETL